MFCYGKCVLQILEIFPSGNWRRLGEGFGDVEFIIDSLDLRFTIREV